MKIKNVSVLVAGSWGTALATVLAHNQLNVKLWSRNEAQVEEINHQRENKKYLPGFPIPAQVEATTSLEEAVKTADAIILAAPSSAMREIVRAMKPFYRSDTLIIHSTKGFELHTLNRMTTVIAEELPDCDPENIVVLSGPSHAEEVVQKKPTTVVVASTNMDTATMAQDIFNNAYFRVYTNPDIVGVEVGGALKNIIAIGAGLSDGLGFGDNAKAALLTRGLAEMSRLGIAMGANPLTFSGLAGIGDLIVTCTSQHSRNWRAGYLLAQGNTAEQVLEKMGMVVEGMKTTQSAYNLAKKYNVIMPITEQLYYVLFHGKEPKLAVEDLMGRGKTHEIEEVARHAYVKWMQ